MSRFLKNSNGLWAFQSSSMTRTQLNDRIREWNESQSRIYPHCQICLLFKKQSCNNNATAASGGGGKSKLPMNSEKLVTEICFTKKISFSKKDDALITQSDLDTTLDPNDNIDCLLQCKMCKLTVHKSKFISHFVMLKKGKICFFTTTVMNIFCKNF
jgi:hypothetical protein